MAQMTVDEALAILYELPLDLALEKGCPDWRRITRVIRVMDDELNRPTQQMLRLLERGNPTMLTICTPLYADGSWTIGFLPSPVHSFHKWNDGKTLDEAAQQVLDEL